LSLPSTNGNLVGQKVPQTFSFIRYVSGRRRSSNEFSFAAFDFAYAGERLLAASFYRVVRGNSRRYRLQLRRLHADLVGEAVGFPPNDNAVPYRF
jgi:hypothetical protein